MPPVNQAVLASAGIIAVSVAVAAAIAVYESPELRRMADDLRRRIALALHSLGDNVDPNRQPMFNRPEDAEGFLQSRGAVGGDMGVDADDETRRRQREELMYWNAVMEEKKGKEAREAEKAAEAERPSPPSRGSTFDDFLQEESGAEKGTYVFNTGASVRPNNEGLIQRRGVQGVRGLNASVYANPFADENGIDFDDHPGMDVEPHPLSPGQDELLSEDIYNATPKIQHQQVSQPQTLSSPALPPMPEILFDFNDTQGHGEPLLEAGQSSLHPATSHTGPAPAVSPAPLSSRSSVTMDRELGAEEYITAGQEDREDAFASIQAWAQSSNPSFYSPLPVSPAASVSEPEIISDGAITPTYTASVAGSGVDLGNQDVTSRAGGSDFDAMSEDDEAMATPNSWSEVGSVVSESDGPVHA